MVTAERTGAARHRAFVVTKGLTRRRKVLLVLQVQWHLKGYDAFADRNVDHFEWRDARIEDITQVEQEQLAPQILEGL